MQKGSQKGAFLYIAFYILSMLADTLQDHPITQSSVELDVKIHLQEERGTIVHIHYYGIGPIRIWPTTYLVQENGKRKKMIQAYNIPLFPHWKAVNYGHLFTLLFEGLDKDCLTFDLLEDIPESGGFNIEKIMRNDTDVYWLLLGDDD